MSDRSGKVPAHTYLLSTRENVLEQWARSGPPSGTTFVPLRTSAELDSGGIRSEPGAVFVLDGGVPGIDRVMEDVLAESPLARILVVTDERAASVVFALLRRGVKGILTHEAAALHLASAVQVLAQGRMWVPRETLAAFLDDLLASRRAAPIVPGPGTLSRREADVLHALLDNLSNKRIGSRLHISEKTVKSHVSSLFAKFGVQRRADLILGFQATYPSVASLAWTPEDRPGLYRIATSDQ